MWLMTLMIVLFVAALGVGVWGKSRYGGYLSWSPTAVVLVVAVALLFSGHLGLH